MGKLIDLSGNKYGRLLVLCRHEENDGNGKPKWLCKCDCGAETVVSGWSLKSGNTKSCGCLKAEHPARLDHGGCGTKLYRTYKNILQRCYNQNNPKYAVYGGRGIQVCDEWRNSFEAFREWAFNNGYVESSERSSCTIDRIDVDGNYSPENCRWITQKEQMNNLRKSRLATFDGKTKTISQWAEELNLPYNTVYDRAKKNGWKLDTP